MRTVAMAAAVASLAFLSGCGGGDGTPAPTPAALTPSVGGDYTMVVALTESSCGDVTVQPLPTRVEHVPGSTAVRITHGPITYSGTVAAGGAFTTEPRTLPDAAGTPQTIRIDGRFTTSGLEAAVTVTLPTCRYVVRWTGTKQGAPNLV